MAPSTAPVEDKATEEDCQKAEPPMVHPAAALAGATELCEEGSDEEIVAGTGYSPQWR